METMETTVSNGWLEDFRNEMGKVIVGQQYMIDRILVGVLTGGHILLEGVPGLAKTLTASTLADIIGLDFKRIQFTPDLLPADIIGTEIYHQKTGEFHIKQGSIFANLILADEVNRAPAKVQSALLEAMEEKQVTIGTTTYALENPFMVIATQNPLEQQGTYPLPEAQQDRFMLKLKVGYPERDEERQIIDRFSRSDKTTQSPAQVLTAEKIMALRREVDAVYLDDTIKEYVLDIILMTRQAPAYIACGASPRASINLIKGAKAVAYMRGRNHVIPDDVKAIVYDVLRHRIALTYEAEAEDMTPESLIAEMLKGIRLP